MIRIAISSLFALVLASCAVDTELGLDTSINQAGITVAPDDSVIVSIDITYRVGEYAEGARGFQPQSVELYVGDSPVATLTPSAPPGFVGTVNPGESFDTTLTAMSAGPIDSRSLCGAEVRVLFRWLDASVMEFGMTDALTSDVTCS